jgi:transposase-like protein
MIDSNSSYEEFDQGSDTMPQNPTLPELTGKQKRAVEALLATGEVSAAAKEAGVHRDTLHRWLRQQPFAQAVRDAEARALDDLSRLLVRMGRTAAGTLAKAMSDATVPPATRVRAADVTLSRLLQLRELATLEARVADLERLAGIEEPSR